MDLPAGAGRFGGFAAPGLNDAVLAALDGREPAVPLPWAVGRATPPAVEVELTVGDTATVTIELPDASGIQVQLVDADGAPVPGVLDVRHVDGAPSSVVPDELRDAIGEPTGGRAAWAWTHDGAMDVWARPGTYLLSAGHSWRHGRVEDLVVEVAEGALTDVTVTLPEVVARDGWMGVDSHLHGAPSFDGALPMEDRLVTCAATGVPLPIPTDHDRQAEYRDLAAALGLDPRMHVVPGVEVTTILRGHFNLFPIEPAPRRQVNGGALDWWSRHDDTDVLFDRMRSAAGPGALLQVNHPRTPGMFDFAGYDPAEGAPGRETHWSWEFELFELWNGGVDDREVLRTDWFSFLDRGVTAAPTGVSDSHYRYIPCGMGRTDVFVDETDPARVTTEAVVDALAAGHVVAAARATLRVTASSAGGTALLPGDTLVGDRVTVHSTVRAPAWVVPDTLRVWQNGAVVVEQALPESADAEGLWADETWTLDVPTDAWVVVEVEGATPMGATWRQSTPYAIANAVFVDVDGDGWTAPLADAE